MDNYRDDKNEHLVHFRTSRELPVSAVFQTALFCNDQPFPHLPEAVRKIYQELLTCQSGDEAHLNLAYNAYLMDQAYSVIEHDPLTALLLFKAAILVNPKIYYAHIEAAGMLVAMGDHRGAAALYTQVIEILPEVGIGYYQRGGCYANLRRFPQAEADFKKALELDADLPHVRQQLAFVLNDQGKNDEALPHLWEVYGV